MLCSWLQGEYRAFQIIVSSMRSLCCDACPHANTLTKRRVNGSSGRQSDIIPRFSMMSSAGGTITTFTFDKVFWSMFPGSKNQERQGSFGRYPAPYTTQNNVFEGAVCPYCELCAITSNSPLLSNRYRSAFQKIIAEMKFLVAVYSNARQKSSSHVCFRFLFCFWNALRDVLNCCAAIAANRDRSGCGGKMFDRVQHLPLRVRADRLRKNVHHDGRC